MASFYERNQMEVGPNSFCFNKQLKKLLGLIQDRNPNLFVNRALKKQLYYSSRINNDLNLEQ